MPSNSTLFEPPGGTWLRLSPNYATVIRISSAIATVLFFGIVAIAAWFFLHRGWVLGTIAALGVVWLTWRQWRAGRWVRSWGYTQRDGDLCITHGLWWKELTIIPYGRMQMVKVNSGPIDRAFGLASVELITASPSTAASIPGLPIADATILRDQLIELSDAQGSGL